MQHVEDELRRIGSRLAAFPDPFEHAGPCAAQQALSWAAQPDAFKSPYDLIAGSEAGAAGCCTGSRQLAFSDTTALTSDASQPR